MITPDGWLDWADRAPGPDDKVYAAPNAAQGYVAHSAVGYVQAALERLRSDERRPDGRYTAYAAASWHLWIAYDGRVIQHYPFTASCWHAGSRYPNTHFVGAENEGGFRPENEPLTEAQLAANARVIKELAAWRSWPGVRRPSGVEDISANLYEHRECVRWGSAPTACPSDRIDWQALFALLQPAPPPPPAPTVLEQIRGLAAAAHILAWNGDLSLVTEEDRAMVRHVASQL